MENPIEMHLVVPLFLETPIYIFKRVETINYLLVEGFWPPRNTAV